MSGTVTLPRFVALARFEKLFFDPGAGQHHVQGHGGSYVDERQDPRALNEVRVFGPEGKARRFHFGDVPLWFIGREFQGYIDVGAQSRHAVCNDCLGSEYAPTPPTGHDLREVGQELKGGGLDGHGGGDWRGVRERRGPAADRRD